MAATTTPETTVTELTPEFLDHLKRLSPESRARLRALLGAEPVPLSDPLPPVFESNEALREELQRRVDDIDSGRVKPITPEEMFDNVRKALEEARRT